MALMSDYTIYHNLMVDSPAGAVFAAVTQPNHLINWWPMRCSGSPAIGAEYNFYFGPEYDWYGKVSEVEENQLFVIEMTKSDPDWDPTSFGFQLEENNGKTKLKFHHTGWASPNDHFRIASYCWAMLLKGLKDYVETGIILPFEDRS